MSLSKPYLRITRPKAFIPNYIMDSRYAPDRLQLGRAYINIEKELRNIFNYIEPDERNKNVFSFELYSLLLRACTEVELNCKLIMEANGAKPTNGKHFTMTDYIKLERSSKLSKYIAVFPNWRKRADPNDTESELKYEDKKMIPFAKFGDPTPTKPEWYTAYNDVKHDRENFLEKASFDNCIYAVAGILVLLYSQFGSRCVNTYGINNLDMGCWDDDYDGIFDADVIFSIIRPTLNDWAPDELYEFDWKVLSNNPNPFDKFSF